MIAKVISDYAVTPLGAGSATNYEAVASGASALQLHEGTFGVPEPFMASLVNRDAIDAFVGARGNGLTFFEKLAVASAWPALVGADIDPASPEVAYVISTTKANVDDIGTERFTTPDESARRIVAALGGTTAPLVVSNACISGLCAQIAAKRILDSGRARYVVVTGADAQSRFIVSGFQSFKALSADPCKPFDAARTGLNLGEASATIIYEGAGKAAPHEWVLCRGAIRNDANHISGPSRTGEGSYRCLEALHLDSANMPAFINVHGTATPYNDEMEAIAISRAGLSEVPVNSLKGYYGHTMGAAGVLETIISMQAADNRTIIGTRGFDTMGVSCPVNISADNRPVSPANSFVKLLSGFGGCNAAALFTKGGER